MPTTADSEWEEVPAEDWEEVGAPAPPTRAAQKPEGAVDRFLESGPVATYRGMKDTLGNLWKYAQTPEGAQRLLTPGAPHLDLAKKIYEGLRSGSEQQFTKMFEQYDKGGLNERGPDGSLSPVGRGIAAVVPGVGPFAADVVDQGASGDVAGAAGKLGTAVALNEAGRFIPREVGRVMKGREEARALSARQAVRAAEAERNAMVEARARSIREQELAGQQKYVEQAEKVRQVRRDNIPTDVEQVNAKIGATEKDYVGGRDPARAVIRNVGRPEEIADMPPDVLVDRLEQAMQGHQQTAAQRLAQPRSVTTNQTAGMVLDGTIQPLITKLEGWELTKQAGVAKAMQKDLKTMLGKMGSDLQPTDVDALLKKIDDMTGTLGKSARTAPIRNALGDIRKAYVAELYAGDEALAAAKGELRNLPPAKRAAAREARKAQASHGPKQVKEPGIDPVEAPTNLPEVPLQEGQIGFPAPKEAPKGMTPEAQAALRAGVGLSGLNRIAGPFAGYALLRYIEEKMRGR